MSGALRLSVALVSVLAVLGIGTASASEFHGIGFVKGCPSPVPIGGPYSCTYRIFNTFDTTQDTLRVTSITDTVEGAVAFSTSGNILTVGALVFSGPVACTGGSGAGTAGDPYVGATSCLVPYGASIETLPFSHYTVLPQDFGLPDHRLVDTAQLTWNNTCTTPSDECATFGRAANALASAVVGTGAQATSFHGIFFRKDCETPIPVGTPYECSLEVSNVIDTAHDTLRISGLADTVHTAGGDVNSGNVIDDAHWIFDGPVSCTGGSGAGTPHHPYVGATECLVPFGASIESLPIALYTIGAADLLLPGSRMADDALVEWNNTCTVVVGDCTTRQLGAPADTNVRVFLPEFLGFRKALKAAYKAGHDIDVEFGLGDPENGPLAAADARQLASSCQVTVTLDGLAPECAAFKGHGFRAKVDTPKTLAAGHYPLTIEVAGVDVHSEQVTIRH